MRLKRKSGVKTLKPKPMKGSPMVTYPDVVVAKGTKGTRHARDTYPGLCDFNL